MSLNMAATSISACGLTCLLRSAAAVGCSAANTTCVCETPSLATLTAACLEANCTMQDTLDMARLSAATCHLDSPSKLQEVLIVTVVMWAVASMAVILRCLSIYLGRSTHKEDVLVVITIVTSIVPAACLIEMSSLGFGTHIWSLQDGVLSEILLLLYIGEIFYVVILCLAKSSLILFYLRIFPSPRFRAVSYAVLGFTVVSSLIITFLTIFSCRPVALFWDKDIKEGTCLDVTALAYANAAFAVAEDILILALPLSQLPRLQIRRGRKFGVAFMIMLGSFGWVASVVRLRALAVFGQSADPTWDYAPVVNWTVIELAVAVICGCVPAIRSLLARFSPHFAFLGSIHPSSSSSSSNPTAGGRKRQLSEAGQNPNNQKLSHHKRWLLQSTYAEMDAIGSVDSGLIHPLEFKSSNTRSHTRSPQSVDDFESNGISSYYGVVDNVHLGSIAQRTDNERRGSSPGSLVCVYLEEDFHQQAQHV